MVTRKTKALTAALLNSKLGHGRYYDGSSSGLHMLVSKTGSKFWVQRYTLHGKRREAGLGSYPTVSLAQAREKAFRNKQLLNNGFDPKSEKATTKVIPTFSEAVDSYLEIKLDEFSNGKHKDQWRSTLQTYANPFIGKLYVNEITNENILSALKPIWLSKNETAKRLRGRIEKVLAWAKVKGYRSGFNPAAWRDNLSELLPKPSSVQKKRNQPALPHLDAQRWWKALQERDGVGADALRFLTLCASRSGEVRAMVWAEVTVFSKAQAKESGYKGIWVIPADRMKAKREHRVPLTEAILAILERQPKGNADDIVFRAARGGMLSDMTLSALMRRMNKSAIKEGSNGFLDIRSSKPAVPHGLRSTFRDWVAENGQSREAAELQLAHKFGSNVEHAYYRTDLLFERSKLLSAWFEYLKG